MAGAKNHPYHLVNPSIWPLVGAFSGARVASAALVMWMHDVAGGAYVGGRRPDRSPVHDVRLVGRRHRRGHGGDHTPVVQLHLRYGMILFIASEVMFFLAWFWAFFNASLFPSASGVDRRRLAAQGDEGPRSVRLPAAQHPDPALLGNDRDLGPPRPHPRRPQRPDQGPVGDDRARPAVHQHPGL